MDRDRAKQEIRSRYAEYLKPAKKRGTYICPIPGCGNGTGKDGDGMSVDPHGDRLHLKCFKCGFYGDIIELYQQEHGCTAAEAFDGLYKFFGIQVDDYATPHATAPQRAAERPQTTQEQEPGEQAAPDFLGYYKACKGHIADAAAQKYLSFRGLSNKTAEAFMIGYDPEKEQLVIPVSRSFYVARCTTDRWGRRYNNPPGVSVDLFNKRALQNESERPVFITEGAINALSIIEAGGEALALNSAGNWRKLIAELERTPTRSTLILCLDNDSAGEKATAQLAEGLTGLNISFIRGNPSGGYNDPNEALTADRGAFIEAVTATERSTTKPDAVTNYIALLLAGEIERFKEGANRKTGFDNLDKVAGGVYPGLYVLGAISSLGKTTFIHQMADQMAATGEHILYFSLEQSRLEMVSKSLARITAKMNPSSAVTSLQIRAGKMDDAVLDAIDEYRETVGDRVSVIEGNFNCTVSFIGDYVGRYMERNQVKPIVIIDYLQIIQGDPQQRQSTKELIDSNVTELKRLSRSRDIPVFLISSLNRSNYLTPVDFESFKESGGIEYTADVIWGLQLQAINEDIFNKENKIKEKREKIREAKAENPRRIELVCLKNRYGISSYRAAFEYYPQHDLFKPLEDAENDFTPYNGPSPWDKPTRRL